MMIATIAILTASAWALTSTAVAVLLIRAMYLHPRCECGALYLADRRGSVYQDSGPVVVYHALDVCEAVEA